MSQHVVTRFAPSPTGFLHIGGARTALFNWLFARHHGAVQAPDRGHRPGAFDRCGDAGDPGRDDWLGLDWDGDGHSQFESAARHAEVAHELLAKGKAYKCFSTQEEIAAFREAAQAEKRSTLFQSPWRDADPTIHPDAPFAIRLRTPTRRRQP